jgi:sugar/nucleoside kinase (ribokinase family)
LRSHPHTKLLLKKGEYGSSIYYLENPKEPKTSHVKHASRQAISFTDYPDFHLVDTTGAGDCFTGAFALEMLECRNYERAMEFSN